MTRGQRWEDLGPVHHTNNAVSITTSVRVPAGSSMTLSGPYVTRGSVGTADLTVPYHLRFTPYGLTTAALVFEGGTEDLRRLRDLVDQALTSEQPATETAAALADYPGDVEPVDGPQVHRGAYGDEA